MKHLYCRIGNKWVLFSKLPCAKCKWRYSIHCPKCDWNSDGEYNTYGGKMMTEEEAKNDSRKTSTK